MNIDDRHIFYVPIYIENCFLPAEIIPFPKACAILPAPMKPTLADDKSILIFYQTSVECVPKRSQKKNTDDSQFPHETCADVGALDRIKSG